MTPLQWLHVEAASDTTEGDCAHEVRLMLARKNAEIRDLKARLKAVERLVHVVVDYGLPVDEEDELDAALDLKNKNWRKR